jgi:hypothetical protein
MDSWSPGGSAQVFLATGSFRLVPRRNSALCLLGRISSRPRSSAYPLLLFHGPEGSVDNLLMTSVEQAVGHILGVSSS